MRALLAVAQPVCALAIMGWPILVIVFLHWPPTDYLLVFLLPLVFANGSILYLVNKRFTRLYEQAGGKVRYLQPWE